MTYARTLPGMQTRAFDFEIRSTRNSNGRTIEGYVAVFGSVARIDDTRGAFDEEIHRGTFDRYINNVGLPVMQFEHGRDSHFGSLPIGAYEVFEPDARGYFVRGQLIDDPLVEPIRKAIDMKAIKGMSWRMQVPDSGQKWTQAHARSRRDGTERVDKRDIFDADVPEAGPVVFPAYDATSVSVRSLLASFDAEERTALIRELADELRLATDLTGQLRARSAGGGDPDSDPEAVLADLPEFLVARHRALQMTGVIP